MNDPKPWHERNHYERDDEPGDMDGAAQLSGGIGSACIAMVIVIIFIALVAHSCS